MKTIKQLVREHKSVGGLPIRKLSEDETLVKRLDMDRSFQRPFDVTPKISVQNSDDAVYKLVESKFVNNAPVSEITNFSRHVGDTAINYFSDNVERGLRVEIKVPIRFNNFKLNIENPTSFVFRIYRYESNSEKNLFYSMSSSISSSGDAFPIDLGVVLLPGRYMFTCQHNFGNLTSYLYDQSSPFVGWEDNFYFAIKRGAVFNTAWDDNVYEDYWFYLFDFSFEVLCEHLACGYHDEQPLLQQLIPGASFTFKDG